MVRVDIDYEGGLRCQATHQPSGSRVATDAPVDNHGRGESFSPTDLVATALGSCMATIMGIVADRHGWKLDGSHLTVDKVMSEDTPRRIAKLVVDFEGPAALDDAARSALEAAARGCPVRHSIDPAIDVPMTFRWS